MFKGIDHIVIAVKDLDSAVAQYTKLCGMPPSEREELPERGMKMAYFRFEGSYVELVSNIGDEGPIAKRLSERGEGVHLVVMKVDNLARSLSELRDGGVRLVGDPGPGGSANAQVFVHPAQANGVLMQMIER